MANILNADKLEKLAHFSADKLIKIIKKHYINTENNFNADINTKYKQLFYSIINNLNNLENIKDILNKHDSGFGIIFSMIICNKYSYEKYYIPIYLLLLLIDKINININNLVYTIEHFTNLLCYGDPIVIKPKYMKQIYINSLKILLKMGTINNDAYINAIKCYEHFPEVLDLFIDMSIYKQIKLDLKFYQNKIIFNKLINAGYKIEISENTDPYIDDYTAEDVNVVINNCIETIRESAVEYRDAINIRDNIIENLNAKIAQLSMTPPDVSGVDYLAVKINFKSVEKN